MSATAGKPPITRRPLRASFVTPRNVVYQQDGRTIVGYFGRAVSVLDRESRRLLIQGDDEHLVREAVCHFLLSQVGKHVASRGLPRLHALVLARATSIRAVNGRRAPAAVSCVIPVRDGERFLAEAIESVLAQSHPPLEVLVGDDGSRDRSAAIAEGFGPPVRVLRHEQPLGPIPARNLCIREARGELIGFLDCDDLWEPSKLEVQTRWMRTHPDTDVVMAHFQPFRDGPTPLAELPQQRGGLVWSTGLFRASAFERFGLPSQSHGTRGGVFDWFLRASEGKLVSHTLDAVLVRRRFHDANLSYASEELMDQFLDVLKDAVDRRRGRASPHR